MTAVDEKEKELKTRKVVNLRIEVEKFLGGIEELEAAIESGRTRHTIPKFWYNNSHAHQKG